MVRRISSLLLNVIYMSLRKDFCWCLGSLFFLKIWILFWKFLLLFCLRRCSLCGWCDLGKVDSFWWIGVWFLCLVVIVFLKEILLFKVFLLVLRLVIGFVCRLMVRLWMFLKVLRLWSVCLDWSLWSWVGVKVKLLVGIGLGFVRLIDMWFVGFLFFEFGLIVVVLMVVLEFRGVFLLGFGVGDVDEVIIMGVFWGVEVVWLMVVVGGGVLLVEVFLVLFWWILVLFCEEGWFVISRGW